MIEWDAIEDWLELEVGASILSVDGGVEVPIDLLVKKPFKLARWAEFMFGVGPEVVQVTGTHRGTYFGGELALDFMFWPWGRHVGLWVEPEYDLRDSRWRVERARSYGRGAARLVTVSSGAQRRPRKGRHGGPAFGLGTTAPRRAARHPARAGSRFHESSGRPSGERSTPRLG